ncbi:MAG: PEGA domain-containing protein [Vicinamibacterales bacterium]
MKPHDLMNVGALMLVLVLVPATASAQRGGRHHGGHHGGRAMVRPVVIVGQPVAVRPAVVKPVVVAPPVIVRELIIGGWGPSGSFGHSGFGSMPIRTGFGTLPVRTGFETAPVRTGFGIETRLGPAPVTIGGRHAFRSKGFRGFKQRHVGSGVIVVGYPVPYPYSYLPYGFTISSAGLYLPPLEHRSGIDGAAGVTAGASTYWTDLSNETGATSGLSFAVSPAAAEVYVDDVYAGTVQDFSADREPLMVVPGWHRVELRAPGFRTITLDVTLAAGQVIPYEGGLDQLRSY